METNNKITVDFKDFKCELTSNTPDIQKMINLIVINRNKINVDNISITSTSEDFDLEGFQTIIIKSISKLINNLELNKLYFDKAIEDLKKLSSEL